MKTAGIAAVVLVVAGMEGATISHGPVLGGLTATSVKVWARTARTGEFRVRYGLAPEALNRVAGPARTELGRDNTGVVEIAGLRPDTKYFYRVEGGEGGSFKTLPDAEEARSPLNPAGLFNFSFEYACGNQQKIDPTLPAFRTMLEQLKDRIDFAILNGDWLYEEKREYSISEWRKQVGLGETAPPRLLEIAPSITGVWENYKLYLERGRPLAAWHREIPSFFTFDDHELLADLNGCGTVGLRNRRAVFRDVGVEAWNHYLGWSNPRDFEQRITFGKTTLKAGSDVLEDASADFTKLNLAETGTLMVHWGEENDAVFDPKLDEVGGDPNAGVYEIAKVLDAHRLGIRPAAKADSRVSYSIGEFSHYRMRVSNAEFFVLDTRSHRQLHDTRNPYKEDVSMLGAAQKQWLKEGMRASDADFFFVVSSVNLMIPHVHPKQPN
ncbi:MAG: alkaline phosphatase, partial [bacterium]|nr:alkaline phosphatase [bacterium]